jgi:RNA polymerase sigma-70 factor (ECF subfamily)
VTEPSADERLQQLFDFARAAWPGSNVEFECFMAQAESHGAALLKADPDAAAANARDLYLACACGQGQPAALAALERQYLPGAQAAVARIDRSADFVSEVQQILREQLLVGPLPRITTYRGTGPLEAWVRTAAVRVALNLRRRKQPVFDDDPRLPQLEQLDPELAVIQRHQQKDITIALERAVDQLTYDQRLLLRLYYLDGLTLSKIAVLQQISVATAFRHLTAATRTVLAHVRDDLVRRLDLSSAGLDSLLRDVHDHLNVSLNRLLRSSPR